MKFSLIIPCYNESKNIPLLLTRCERLLRELTDIEVILIDNGSTDETPAVLEHLLPQYPGCRSVRIETNQGYGFGILSGLRAAQGDLMGWTHADMQTDPFDIIQGIRIFEQYGDNTFVKGRRYGRPLTDVVFTVSMSLFETLLLRRAMWDINAQPNMFPRAFFEQLDNPPYDFSLDLYVYFKAKEVGLKIKRFPVCFGERVHGTSHWNISWSAKWKFIRRTVDFSLRLLRELKS
ncbi:glycosyltransferase family 2 protein [Pectobacteriaceae bacterium CE70]|nr:glycosyltransferase family 2 protein [Pectobacteriaceae bacterium C52]WJV67613.1 glycosyltransferase family 2 protein [Pectobacteriaceae bacterium CE70]WJY11555.1 glycosyltransferase family 2 protein [Pectobacteriaceae bacterium C80]